MVDVFNCDFARCRDVAAEPPPGALDRSRGFVVVALQAARGPAVALMPVSVGRRPVFSGASYWAIFGI